MDQVTALTQHGEHLILDVQAEQAASLDKKPHFVF